MSPNDVKEAARQNTVDGMSDLEIVSTAFLVISKIDYGISASTMFRLMGELISEMEVVRAVLEAGN